MHDENEIILIAPSDNWGKKIAVTDMSTIATEYKICQIFNSYQENLTINSWNPR